MIAPFSAFLWTCTLKSLKWRFSGWKYKFVQKRPFWLVLQHCSGLWHINSPWHVRLGAYSLRLHICIGSFCKTESIKTGWASFSYFLLEKWSEYHAETDCSVLDSVFTLCIHNVIQLPCTKHSSAKLVWLQLISAHIFPRHHEFECSDYPCAHHRYANLNTAEHWAI